MKTKVKFYALLLSVTMFLLSLTGLGGAILAHADGQLGPYEDYEFPEYVSDADYVADPDGSLTSLYYISDYSGSKNFFYNGFIGSYISQNPYITHSEFYYFNNNFWEQTQNLYEEMLKVENAFIIFEVRNSLLYDTCVFDGTEPEETIEALYQKSEYLFMENLFYGLKANNCKIMFIGGLDEVWFQDCDDGFLDYVDIHINTDLLTTFTYSVACEIVEKSGGGGQDAVMVFDSVMSQDWFFRDYFIPYLVFAVNEYGGDLKYRMPENVLHYLHSTAYFYDDEMKYYTDIFGNIVSEEDVAEKFNASSFSCVVADVRSLACDELLDLWANHGNAEYYMHNVWWKEVQEDELPSDMMYFGMSEGSLDYYLSVIMRDFILNDLESLQKYDNWDGRCNVTFRLMWGKGGWLRLPKRFTALSDPLD